MASLAMRKITEKIKSYPTAFGGLIGLLIVGAIFIIETWFPWLGNAWERHNSLVRSIYFTLVLFAVWISRLWRWRHRGPFWAAMFHFFALHIAGVSLYTAYVHGPTLRQWIVLIVVESFLLVFFLDWFMRRFGRQVRREKLGAVDQM